MRLLSIDTSFSFFNLSVVEDGQPINAILRGQQKEGLGAFAYPFKQTGYKARGF
jgi:hypothetical protein